MFRIFNLSFLSLALSLLVVILPGAPSALLSSRFGLSSTFGSAFCLAASTGHNVHPRAGAHMRRVFASENTDKVRNKNTTLVEVEKRGGAARFTRYVAGRGACGGFNSDNDFIVALNRPEWDNGAHCYDSITITYKGKTAQAQIVDECMGCPPNALDLSNGLFAYFEDPLSGVFYGDWTYGSGAVISSSTPPPPTSTKSKPTPTSSTTHSTTTSAKPTTSHTSTSMSASKETSSTTALESTSTSASATPAPTPDSEALSLLNMALVGLGGLIVQAQFT